MEGGTLALPIGTTRPPPSLDLARDSFRNKGLAMTFSPRFEFFPETGVPRLRTH